MSLQLCFMDVNFGDLAEALWLDNIEKVFLNILSISIQVKIIIPHSIILHEFDAYYLLALKVFYIIKILNIIHHMISRTPNSKRYPILALKSSIQLASKGIRWWCYSKENSLLQIIDLSIRKIHPSHILDMNFNHSTRDNNKRIRKEIYSSYTKINWIEQKNHFHQSSHIIFNFT